jgi:hypothetical protein
MARRHGIFECTVCGAQLRAKPAKGTKRCHDKLTTFAPKDHVGRWAYTPKNDEFAHIHRLGGKTHVFKAEFVEDFEFEGEGDERADDKGVARKD